MSNLNRACTFCGRGRQHYDGRMITLRSTVPENQPHPDVSVCWSCLQRPITDLVAPLKAQL